MQQASINGPAALPTVIKSGTPFDWFLQRLVLPNLLTRSERRILYPRMGRHGFQVQKGGTGLLSDRCLQWIWRGTDDDRFSTIALIFLIARLNTRWHLSLRAGHPLASRSLNRQPQK
jgi:hypothetical protein